MQIPPRKSPVPSSDSSEKQALRLESRRRLRSVSIRQQKDAASRATGHLLSMPALASAENILLYASLPRELNTDRLFHALKSRGIQVAYPITHPSLRQMSVHWVDSLQDLTPSSLGIREPASTPSTQADPASLHAVVVPGLAFDRYGHRLGRGKGYYDSFLCPLPTSVLRIGFFYSLQEFDLVPSNELDATLDWIVTEKEFFRPTPASSPAPIPRLNRPKSDGVRLPPPIPRGHLSLPRE